MSNDPRRHAGTPFDGDLRAALVEAAAAAIAEDGVERLSLRDVARRVGVSHAAPGYHFGDKAGLLTAVATDGFERFLAHMSRAVTAAGTEPAEVLTALARGYIRFTDRHRGHFAVMFDPSLIDAGDPAYITASDAAFDALCVAIALCQEAGWRMGEDTTGLAAGAWAFAHGLAVLRHQGSLGRHVRSTSADSLAAIGVSLLAPPAAPG